MSDYGVTDNGFVIKRLPEILEDMFDDFEDNTGETINRDPDSVVSQLFGVFAQPAADIWERMQEVYDSQYPASAEGFSLDSVAQLVGLERLAASNSVATVLLTGTKGTIVPLGNKFRIPDTLNDFSTTELKEIDNLNCAGVDIRAVGAPAIQTYQITINSTIYVFSDVGGTLNQYQVAQNFETIINADTANKVMTATAVSEGGATGRLELRSDDEISGYAVTDDTNTKIDESNIQTPVAVKADNTGSVLVLADTITEIVNSVSGLDSVNNPVEGTIGRDLETDVELRERRAESLAIIGASTVEAIRTQIFQNVTSVTSVQVYENDTNIDDVLVIDFSADFVTSNNILSEVNGLTLPTVLFTTDQATTIALLATNWQTNSPEILTAVVTGARQITVTPNSTDHVLFNSIEVTGGASQAVAAVSGSSRPQHSIECVVIGGTDADVAEQIWESKPAGILTHGSEEETVTDSQGVNHQIEFTRPVAVELWVDVVITTSTEEEFPTGGTGQIATDLLTALSDLDVGEDVLIQKLYNAIYQTQGVYSASVTLQTGAGPYTPPHSITDNIPIDELHYAEASADRITVSTV